MVSLIQECLGEVFFGCPAGRFMYNVLGKAIRRDIMTTARQIIGFPHLEAVRILHQFNISSFLTLNTCILIARRYDQTLFNSGPNVS